jgi:hypothetical protein
MTTATPSTSIQLFNHPKLPGLTALITQIEDNYTFASWNEYIDVISSSPDAALLPIGLEPENLDDCKRTWAEQAPLNREDDSLNFLSELIQSFCDHILLWSYVHDAPLLNPITT